jgi:hypothetical protein
MVQNKVAIILPPDFADFNFVYHGDRGCFPLFFHASTPGYGEVPTYLLQYKCADEMRVNNGMLLLE